MQVKQAVKTAIECIKNLYENDSEKLIDLRLEEIEYSEDTEFHSYWSVTVSFIEQATTSESIIPLIQAGTPSYERVYKIIKIQDFGDHGDLVSMKIREFNKS